MNILQKPKLAFAALIVAAGIASPAYAQSISRDTGTGNVLPFSYGPVAGAEQHTPLARYSRGHEAYASAPRRPLRRHIYGGPPAGGSSGYNELLMNY